MIRSHAFSRDAWRSIFVSGCAMILTHVFVMAGSGQTTLSRSTLPAGLPAVLTMSNGAKVTTPAQWQLRRAELLQMFTQQEYGVAPSRPKSMRFVVVDDTRNALGGLARRKQVRILLQGTESGPKLDLLLYIPNQTERPPVFLGLNFWGNETVNADPGILISSRWTQSAENHPPDPNTAACLKGHRATPACRGIAADKWPIETILQRGYAVATVFRADIDPDYKGSYQESLKIYYPQLQGRGDNFSTIGAWAWALRRIQDYLETDDDVDASKVAVFGWSRLGKAALWAAAQDPRFAMAISDDSGAGGAKLFRRDKGETIRDLNTVFPDWFCKNFKQYDGQDRTLPFDQHMLIALIAPRPVYIASAIDDHWADPEGEFLSGVAATPVYRLLGTDGLPASEWPQVNHPVMGQIGYHVRSGGHNITFYDWAQYLNFADMHLKESGQTGNRAQRNGTAK
jgi:hypothetical protein